MTVASNSIIFTTISEQNRHNKQNCQNRGTADITLSKSQSEQKQTNKTTRITFFFAAGGVKY